MYLKCAVLLLVFTIVLTNLPKVKLDSSVNDGTNEAQANGNDTPDPNNNFFSLIGCNAKITLRTRSRNHQKMLEEQITSSRKRRNQDYSEESSEEEKKEEFQTIPSANHYPQHVRVRLAELPSTFPSQQPDIQAPPYFPPPNPTTFVSSSTNISGSPDSSAFAITSANSSLQVSSLPNKGSITASSEALAHANKTDEGTITDRNATHVFWTTWKNWTSSSSWSSWNSWSSWTTWTENTPVKPGQVTLLPPKQPIPPELQEQFAQAHPQLQISPPSQQQPQNPQGQKFTQLQNQQGNQQKFTQSSPNQQGGGQTFTQSQYQQGPTYVQPINPQGQPPQIIQLSPQSISNQEQIQVSTSTQQTPQRLPPRPSFTIGKQGDTNSNVVQKTRSIYK